ncbi:MAG: twin-arginine translocase subunit TatC [Campylobacterales bacterium]|nr:twin-arginine translocase subunit TatC [Campylobacterales bacterium]
MFHDIKPHLAELRTRLFNSVIAVFIFFGISFMFYEPILEWMKQPLVDAMPKDTQIIATGVAEAFFTAIKVAFFSGLMLALPVIFWQFWLFVAPGLYENEKKYVVPFVSAATLMFLMGAAFAYYVVVPFGFEFLINFGSTIAVVTPRIGEYVGFFTKIMIGFGISFELPVITFFFAVLGLVDDEMLKDFFKYAVVIIFIIASLLTPPDVITQLLMAGPMILLYGISIMIAKMVNPAPPKDDDKEEETN